MASITVDIDLDEFDDREIIEAVEWRGLSKEIAERYMKVTFAKTDNPVNTIRDDQYEDVFSRLKEKFSVAQLEDFINSK